MPPRSCRPSLWSLCGLALLAAGTAPPAGAAPTTFADPAGVCAGLSPCFVTLQEAVNNAGPAPAVIHVFPGTYPESVDVTSMGSAIGQGVGDLTIEGVDAGGLPATGLATIDPGAPGGPGSGPGVWVVDPNVGVVTMSLTLRGLQATSPDGLGFAALVSGDLALSDLEADGCGDSGITMSAAGTITARDLTALLNVGTGIYLGAETRLEAESLVAERNDGGIVLIGTGELVATNLRATSNGGGISVLACNGADLEGLQALSNAGQGILIQQPSIGTSPCTGSPLTLVHDAGGRGPVAGSWSVSFDDVIAAWLRRRQHRPTKAAPSGRPPVVLRSSQSLDNGEEGIIIFVDGPASVDGSTARGNGFVGLGMIASTAQVAASIFDQNSGGATVGGESVTVTSCRANDNLGGGGGFPGDGYGFTIGAEVAQLAGLEGSRNPEAGLALNLFVDQPPTFDLAGGTFEDNRAGVETVAGLALPSVALHQVVARGNDVGVLLPFASRATLDGCLLESNALGLRASPTVSLAVTLSTIAGNQVGAGLDLAPGATAAIQCSNFTTSSSGVGLELLSDSHVEASANFWGSPLGPTHPANPGGAGERILDASGGAFGTVEFVPFLEVPATEQDCQVVVQPEAVPLSPLALTVLVLLMAYAGATRLRISAP